MAGEAEIACPMCSGAPRLRDLDSFVLDLIDERGLSENAESALRAIWAGAGRPVTADPIWDEVFKFDPDGGPSLARMYSELSAALNELQGKLDGTGLVVIRQGREGWRLGLVEGGAYLAA